MHISLTDTLDKYVRDRVATGLYNNASEVIREALRLKIAADQREAAKLEALCAAIDEADADIAAGRVEEYYPGFLDDLDETAATHAAE